LSADGNTALVGGNADVNFIGAAWVFIRTAELWGDQAKLVGTGAVGAPEQGFSVALSADGNTAVVGGFGDNNSAGAAWGFTRTGWRGCAGAVGGGGPSRAHSWSARVRLEAPSKASPSRCPPTASPPLWVGILTTLVPARRGCSSRRPPPPLTTSTATSGATSLGGTAPAAKWCCGSRMAPS